MYTTNENLELFRASFEHAAVGLLVTDPDGRLLEVNPAYCQITGYSEAELRRDCLPQTLVHPADLPIIGEKLDALLRGDIPAYVQRIRYVQKDGRVVWVQNNVSLVRDERGQPAYVVRITQDITETKIAEASTKAAQAQNEKMLAGVTDLHILLDRSWRYIYVNDAAVNAIGKPREQILGRTLWEMYPDIVGTELEFQFRRAMDQRASVIFPFHYRTNDTWWENRFQSTPEGLAIFATDITERNRALELLRQKEREFAEAQQLATVGSWNWDLKTWLVTTSDELNRILGLPSEHSTESFDEMIKLVHHEDRDDVLQTLERCIKTRERYTQSFRVVRPDGQVRLLQVVGTIVSDEDGVPVRLFGLSHDNTELEHSKEAQRAAERKYRKIFENAGEGIFQSTPEGCYITANPALARMHGFESSLELIHSCRDISREIYVDPARRDEFKRLLNEEGIVRGFEHETFRKDGSKIWISVNARAVRDEYGEILYYEGTTQDITERKHAEQALRQSEERYRELFENSKNALYVHDMEGRYTSVNKAAERLAGFSREEIIGQHFSNFVNPVHQAGVRAQLCKKLEDAGETSYEIEMITKQGNMVPVEVSSRLILENGRPTGVQGCVRDITERKQALEAARNYSRLVIGAQEAERRRISGELHDQVGQILTAVKMNLHSLREKCDAPDILASIEKNIEVIDEAVDQVRTISVNLRPLLLDDFGLVVALRWYLDRQARNLGVPAKLNTRSLSEDDRFSSELETACFRIVQEALTNVVKHAQATHVSVMLERTRSDLILLVTDDGVGFDVRGLRKGSTGRITLGLRGMEERVQAVGGSITIDSAPALGTEICARFPLQEAARTFALAESRLTSLAKRTSSMSSG